MYTGLKISECLSMLDRTMQLHCFLQVHCASLEEAGQDTHKQRETDGLKDGL